MIKVLCASTEPLSDNKKTDSCYRMLSDDRKQKADRCNSPEKKKLSIAAGRLLEMTLAADFGIDLNGICYIIGEHGKPSLSCAPQISFNISHSRNFVLLSISDDENIQLGCDIENIRPIDLRISERFFYHGEHDYLMSLTDESSTRNAFFRFWTLKESFMKAVGKGFALPFNAFEIYFDGHGEAHVKQNISPLTFYFSEYEIPDFKISVCSSKKADAKFILTEL